jgi:uncharacterized protein (TIGR02996 family)
MAENLCHNDELAFIRGLNLSDPYDHALRGVFADWLEERGDWRAPGYRMIFESDLRPSLIPESIAPQGNAYRNWYWWITDVKACCFLVGVGMMPNTFYPSIASAELGICKGVDNRLNGFEPDGETILRCAEEWNSCRLLLN